MHMFPEAPAADLPDMRSFARETVYERVRQDGRSNVEIGVGLDRNLGFSVGEYRELSRVAARLGYASIWTNSMNGRESTQMCTQFWSASAEVVEGGLQTGISVVPATFWTVPSLASAAATTAEITDGRFTLGVGSGDVHDLSQRRLLGLQA